MPGRFRDTAEGRTTPPTTSEEQVAGNSNILSDRIGFLPRKNAGPPRRRDQTKKLVIDSGKVLRVATNDLDAPAQEIADLYKQRWEIELFFRWIKQTLRITHFIGVSENAVRIQIAVALIAFLLLRLAQATQSMIRSPLEFARLITANLMNRRPINGLLGPLPSLSWNPDQLSLMLCCK